MALSRNPAAFVPQLESDDDTRYFDRTQDMAEMIEFGPTNSTPPRNYPLLFREFSFIRGNSFSDGSSSIQSTPSSSHQGLFFSSPRNPSNRFSVCFSFLATSKHFVQRLDCVCRRLWPAFCPHKPQLPFSGEKHCGADRGGIGCVPGGGGWGLGESACVRLESLKWETDAKRARGAEEICACSFRMAGRRDRDRLHLSTRQRGRRVGRRG